MKNENGIITITANLDRYSYEWNPCTCDGPECKAEFTTAFHGVIGNIWNHADAMTGKEGYHIGIKILFIPEHIGNGEFTNRYVEEFPLCLVKTLIDFDFPTKEMAKVTCEKLMSGIIGHSIDATLRGYASAVSMLLDMGDESRQVEMDCLQGTIQAMFTHWVNEITKSDTVNIKRIIDLSGHGAKGGNYVN